MRYVFTVIVAAALALPALGHEGHAHRNLNVLQDLDQKSLDDGMKGWAKALGVQCTACHVKSKWDSDDVATKGVAREMLAQALRDPSPEGRQAALAPLLRALDRPKPADEAKLWAIIDRWRALVPPPKTDDGAAHESHAKPSASPSHHH